MPQIPQTLIRHSFFFFLVVGSLLAPLDCLVFQEKFIQQSAPYETQLLDCASNTQLNQGPPNQRCRPFKRPNLATTNGPSSLYTKSFGGQVQQPHEANRSSVENESISTSNYNQANCQQQTVGHIRNEPLKDLPLVICSSSSSSSISPSHTPSSQQHQKPIQIYIVGPPEASSTTARLPIGSSLEIQCRFSVHLLANERQDLRFKLRWMRLVASSQGQNQSISHLATNSHTNGAETPGDYEPSERASINVVATRNDLNPANSDSAHESNNPSRHWTVQRDGGLDLMLNNFKPSDAGDYFCQAIAAPDETASGPLIVLDEKRIQLAVDESELVGHVDDPEGSTAPTTTPPSDLDFNYSQENLAKLLPSLKISPELVQASLGETIQLACLTSNLDPDPELSSADLATIEWSFEPLIRPGDERQPNYQYHIFDADSAEQTRLPSDISQLGNILIIWSVTQQHCGIYKCRLDLPDFKLSSEATGELRLRPPSDSAPLVFVEPELLRLSPNGSASLRCESTGFPVPQIDWYRVDSIVSTTSTTTPTTNASSGSMFADLEQVDGIHLEQIATQDSMAYCEQLPPPGCSALAVASKVSSPKHHQSNRQSAANIELTRISLLHIEQARAEHQGQYVCKASNKHGSNQASSIVDVEYRQLPQVRLVGQQQQVIQLPSSINSLAISSPPLDGTGSMLLKQQGLWSSNVTFKCTIEAGRPKPRLRWLRAPINRRQLGETGVDLIGEQQSIYNDLNRVSSATSKVYTWFEDQGQTLALSISTVSLDDEGEYVCLGENELGKHSVVGHLTVQQAATLRILQSSPKVAKLNSSFQLDCLATGYPAPQDIEWSRSDRGAFFALISSGGGDKTGAQAKSNHQQPNQRATLKFDQITPEEAGEYTCAARDPLDSGKILRDTIMLLVGDPSTLDTRHLADGDDDLNIEPSTMRPLQDPTKLQTSAGQPVGPNYNARQLPKLMIRPTKINALMGTNVTLDCLAISGLQPTLVEWLPPTNLISHNHQSPPYNLTNRTTATLGSEPPNIHHQSAGAAGLVSVRPYYRSRGGVGDFGDSNHLLQFGSKLRIINISRSHEGVYQCKGRNRAGVELAPALIRLIEVPTNGTTNETVPDTRSDPNHHHHEDARQHQLETKTKVAKLGSNIELRCQVNGMQQQPATSWSRDGRELPKASVQIGHNLWIQNLTQADEGLYLCSARSSEPNRVIQAKINLLVRAMPASGATVGQNQSWAPSKPALGAKIVASKAHLQPGDSVTLECILSFLASPRLDHEQRSAPNRTLADVSPDGDEDELGARSDELDELERQIVWTNLHSGESLFQDNVYIQNNLLIIYNLRLENSATYRCNYNDLSQHTDYKLIVGSLDNTISNPLHSSPGSSLNAGLERGSANEILNHSSSLSLPVDGQLLYATHNGTQQVAAQYRQIAINSRLIMDCPSVQRQSASGANLSHHWTRYADGHLFNITPTSSSLVFGSISSADADLYQCETSHSPLPLPSPVLINVQVISAKFVQRPCSFVSLPALANNEQQLFGEIELKFLPESADGLLLYSGAITTTSQAGNTNGHPQSQSANGSISASGKQSPQITTLVNQGDYVSLGLQQGFVEFKFELGDGSTVLRSSRPVTLNQWHRLVIERNRRGAVMWLDGRPPVTNSSLGKFFNLNLDSVLFVGGHQVFSQPSPDHQVRLSGYSRGFQGCIGSLLINRHEMELIARNRSASIGVYECDKSECKPADCSPTPAGGLTGVCQVDRSLTNRRRQLSWGPAPSELAATSQDQYRRRQSQANWDLRCVCLPGFMGPQCSTAAAYTSSNASAPGLLDKASSAGAGPSSVSAPEPTNWTGGGTSSQPARPSNADDVADHVRQPLLGSACHHVMPGSQPACNPNGTLECQQMSSSSIRCHCRLGAMGDRCEQVAQFEDPNGPGAPVGGGAMSLGFNRAAYLQFRFSFLEEFVNLSSHQAGATSPNRAPMPAADASTRANNSLDPSATDLTASDFLRLSSFVETLNVSFNLQTRSSFGLVFYTGGQLVAHSAGQPSALVQQPIQVSKSVVANQLTRLAANRGIDFLAIALVDGHLELSFELGSGLAIIRSTRRINDGLWHQIQVHRQGRQAKLIIDEQFKFQGHSPGRLSMLNGADDIYLGGLPHFQHQQASVVGIGGGGGGGTGGKATNHVIASPSSTSGPLLGNFSGCLSELRINSLGPLNLIANSSLLRIRSGRNLVPCSALDWSPPAAPPGAASGDRAGPGKASKPVAREPPVASTFGSPSATETTPTSISATKKPAGGYVPTTESEPDDSDESS